MAMSFPLATATFLERLPVSRITFDLPEQSELSQTGGGVIYAADLAPRLWQGEIRLDQLSPAEEADAMALIDLLRGPGRTAMIYDLRRPTPRADPKGSILGGASPVIQQLAATRRELGISGLPVGYELRRGDYMAWDYLGRRAVHKVVSASVTASGAGVTPLVEVVPAIRPGVTVGAAVRLTRAACVAMLVPGSVSPGATGGNRLTDGVTFRFCQTLEAL